MRAEHKVLFHILRSDAPLRDFPLHAPCLVKVRAIQNRTTPHILPLLGKDESCVVFFFEYLTYPIFGPDPALFAFVFEAKLFEFTDRGAQFELFALPRIRTSSRDHTQFTQNLIMPWILIVDRYS